MDKKLLFIANWKSNKTCSDTVEWLAHFSDEMTRLSLDNKDIVICPPFTALFSAYMYIKEHKLPISLGAQDVSPFDEGMHTGEIAPIQIKELADYVIIGHSERRREFLEDDAIIAKKVQSAKAVGLATIVCLQDENAQVPKGADILVYEPPRAISSGIPGKPGVPDDPRKISQVFTQIHNKTNKNELLYGGSVASSTIDAFSAIPLLRGFLVGGASLDYLEFARLLSKC